METETKSAPDLGIVGAILGILALVVAVVAVGFSLTGDDDGSSIKAGGGSTEVELGDFFIKPASATVAAGSTLKLVNSGNVQHNLSVVDEGLASPMLDAGASGELSLAGLAPGTYKIRCDVPGHESAGMAGELTVTEGAGEVAAAATGGHSSGGHGDMSWEEMDKSMLERVKAFPQETSAHGAEDMAPKIVDGVKVFDLTAKIVKWELEKGKVVEGWTYNGTVPGPTIKVDVGDKVRINLKNELPESTGLHLHGIEKLANKMDGVPDITQDPIHPGESFSYEFTATAPAVAMYHSHHNATKQVGNGMLGALMVGQIPLPAGSSVDQEIPMVLNDTGTIGFSLNGKSFPATKPYTAKLGDQILVHYMNEGVTGHPMHLHGMPGVVVARDGYGSPPQRLDTIMVNPGERVSVLYDITEPGVWAWHCHILPHAESSTGMFGMVTALIVE
ncbi:MAG TPA: multicopper oxidase domain-containing protein [Acidimicrobiales bacterium]|jgi:manganese oxidase|nr:multicopper oxidase domain-containing protein [Acidimicrobiales bacterium]